MPERVWDYLTVWVCDTVNLSVSSYQYDNGQTALEIVTGETSDIREYIDFGFYKWVIYQDNYVLGELSIGRWLCVSHNVGKLMSYWIITVSGKFISSVNVQRLTEAEQATDEYLLQLKNFDELFADRLDAKGKEFNIAEVPEWNRLSLDEYDPELFY